jgi:hypothetical protein
LKYVNEEISKLNLIAAKFKIIVTRPRLRRLNGQKDIYPEASEYYRKKIRDYLSGLNILETEKWMIILIAPRESLKPGDETDIVFFNYMRNSGDLILDGDIKTFKVKMNSNYEVILKN